MLHVDFQWRAPALVSAASPVQCETEVTHNPITLLAIMGRLSTRPSLQVAVILLCVALYWAKSKPILLPQFTYGLEPQPCFWQAFGALHLQNQIWVANRIGIFFTQRENNRGEFFKLLLDTSWIWGYSILTVPLLIIERWTWHRWECEQAICWWPGNAWVQDMLDHATFHGSPCVSYTSR